MSERNRRQTRSMLEYVVDAITKINDPHGSNTRSIVRHINCTMADKFLNRRNGVTMQVRKALKQGSESGLLLHLAGKYKLSLRRPKNKNLVEPSTKPLVKTTNKAKSAALRKKSHKQSYSGKVRSLCRNTNASSCKTTCCKKKARKNKQRRKSRGRRKRCHSLASETGSANNGDDCDKKPSSQNVTKSDNGNNICH